MTDAEGVALTTADPFDNDTRGGCAAADELDGTPFRRPEDVEVGYLKNGDEALYFVATEELSDDKAMVHLAADENTAKNLGYPETSSHVTSPDNLAQDALGNIYVVEDWPNGDNKGGDIWFKGDTDNNGVAESLDYFMSLQVKGAENSSMILYPSQSKPVFINVQHPESTAVDCGQGDATWLV